MKAPPKTGGVVKRADVQENTKIAKHVPKTLKRPRAEQSPETFEYVAQGIEMALCEDVGTFSERRGSCQHENFQHIARTVFRTLLFL